MLGDRVRDLGRLAVMERVIAAHHALQLGKFADHAARQIGLGEPDGLAQFRLVGARHVLRHHFGQLGDARHLVVDAAELGVENPALEARHTLDQLDLAVLVPEEARIGEPRPQHALVAGDDRLAADRRAAMFETTRNRGARLPLASRQAKYFWCVRIAEVSTSGGRSMNAWSIRPHQNHRPFDQAGDLVEQQLVGLDFELGRGRRLGKTVRRSACGARLRRAPPSPP